MTYQDAWVVLIRHVVKTAPANVDDRAEVFSAMSLAIPSDHPLFHEICEASTHLHSHVVALREIGQTTANFDEGRTK